MIQSKLRKSKGIFIFAKERKPFKGLPSYYYWHLNNLAKSRAGGKKRMRKQGYIVRSLGT